MVREGKAAKEVVLFEYEDELNGGFCCIDAEVREVLAGLWNGEGESGWVGGSLVSGCGGNSGAQKLEKGSTPHPDPSPVVVYLEVDCGAEVTLAWKEVVRMEVGE